MKHKQTLIWAVIITAAAILLGLFFWDFSSHVNEILAGEGYADSIANQCISLCLKILLVLVCMVVCNAVMLEKRAQTLRQNNRELDALTANIPGGVQQCADDEFLTLLYVSDGFLEMTGFSPEEISSHFENKYINMIFPADREKVKEMLKVQDPQQFEMQYRILCKDGSTLWILDKGQLVKDNYGVKTYYCVLVDINRMKQAERALTASRNEIQMINERYQVVIEQSDSIIFEVDLINHSIVVNNLFQKKMGYEPICSDFPDSTVEEGLVHPDDVDRFLEFYHETVLKEGFHDVEYRLKNANGSFIWVRISLTTLCGSAGEPIRAIGKIDDITNQRAENQKLKAQSENDLLTGTYNKTTAEKYIHNAFQEQYHSMHALLMLDLDNYGQMNVTFGRGFCDTILQDVSEKMKKTFRGSDIIGRIGSDEFVILMCDVRNPEIIKEKAQDICERINSVYSSGGVDCHITASVGVAVFPQDGTTYDELYKKADTALYRAKANGKNTYMFYSQRSPQDDSEEI